MNIFTIAFFGHRDFNRHLQCEKTLEVTIKNILDKYDYVYFLVGKNGEFDQFVTSVIHRIKREYNSNNSSLILTLPYLTAEYKKSEKQFYDYYDEIEICENISHFKSAIQIRNRAMVDRADLVIGLVERNKGGAYQAVKYAQARSKSIINLAKT